jgi:hypothetical protein
MLKNSPQIRIPTIMNGNNKKITLTNLKTVINTRKLTQTVTSRSKLTKTIISPRKLTSKRKIKRIIIKDLSLFKEIAVTQRTFRV